MEGHAGRGPRSPGHDRPPGRAGAHHPPPPRGRGGGQRGGAISGGGAGRGRRGPSTRRAALRWGPLRARAGRGTLGRLLRGRHGSHGGAGAPLGAPLGGRLGGPRGRPVFAAGSGRGSVGAPLRHTRVHSGHCCAATPTHRGPPACLVTTIPPGHEGAGPGAPQGAPRARTGASRFSAGGRCTPVPGQGRHPPRALRRTLRGRARTLRAPHPGAIVASHPGPRVRPGTPAGLAARGRTRASHPPRRAAEGGPRGAPARAGGAEVGRRGPSGASWAAHPRRSTPVDLAGPGALVCRVSPTTRAGDCTDKCVLQCRAAWRSWGLHVPADSAR